MMIDEERVPYLDFYSQNNVSPVLNQGIDEILIKARSALYTQLGISSLNIKGLNVLEFGPGNGTNSLYTLCRCNLKITFWLMATHSELKTAKKTLKHAFQMKIGSWLNRVLKTIATRTVMHW